MRTLLMLSLLSLGTLSLGARAAEDPATAAPVCQNVQDEAGQPGLVCDNLTNDQALSLNQDPDARRRCYRVCSFRVFRFCVRWHVECWGHRGHGWGGGWR